jgi:hypothetical protein
MQVAFARSSVQRSFAIVVLGEEEVNGQKLSRDFIECPVPCSAM